MRILVFETAQAYGAEELTGAPVSRGPFEFLRLSL